MDGEDRAFVVAFRMSGLMAAVDEWMRGGCRESHYDQSHDLYFDYTYTTDATYSK